jgi:hypothetical protein
MAGVTHAGTKKRFNGFDFSIPERVIFHIVNNLVVGCGDIIHGERAAPIHHNLNKFNLFEVLGPGRPAFFFVPGQIYMVIRIGARETKIARNLVGKQIPILRLKPGEKVSYACLCSL